jgi:hypothetical protein
MNYNEFLSYEGLKKLWEIIKSTFVAKEEGKGLSTNDYTNEDKNKLDSIASNSEKNIIIGIKRNDTLLTPDNDRVINIPIPTKTSELTNDSDY